MTGQRQHTRRSLGVDLAIEFLHFDIKIPCGQRGTALRTKLLLYGADPVPGLPVSPHAPASAVPTLAHPCCAFL